ncbi:MAG TPA: hypothetical protein PK771_10650, partial [Spirochaetota bacterium]|nr:hypothetical protein [Spirochaetota bacterium]
AFSTKTITVSPRKRVTKNIILKADLNSINISKINVTFKDDTEFNKIYDLTIRMGEIFVIPVSKTQKEVDKIIIDCKSLNDVNKKKKGIIHIFLD